MKTNNNFSFVVDYNRSVEEMVRAGKYDWLDTNVIDRYPIPKNKIGQSESISTELLNFNRLMYYEEAIEEIAKKGYRSATAHEILVFGEKNLELQEESPIISLESVWQIEAYRAVLALYGNPSRSLFNYDLNRTLLIGGDFPAICRFLVVRK
ncbi:MAG TPA: hypothetical protein VIK86_03385 [Candidatus Paceibacterota bacterium]